MDRSTTQARGSATKNMIRQNTQGPVECRSPLRRASHSKGRPEPYPVCGRDNFAFEYDGLGVIFDDNIAVENHNYMSPTGAYLVTTYPDLQEQLTARYDELAAAENALGFDPFTNDADIEALLQAGGYESLDAAGCGDINP